MSQGPALVIKASALQFGLLRLGQKATDSIQIQNVSQLPATWCMKESLVCLQERQESVSQAPLAKWTPPKHTHKPVDPWGRDSETCPGAFGVLRLERKCLPGDSLLAVSPVLPICEALGVPSTAELNPELDFPVPFSTIRCGNKTGVFPSVETSWGPLGGSVT